MVHLPHNSRNKFYLSVPATHTITPDDMVTVLEGDFDNVKSPSYTVNIRKGSTNLGNATISKYSLDKHLNGGIIRIKSSDFHDFQY